MKTEADYAALLTDIKKEFPKFKVVQKGDSSFMKLIDKALKLITFGKQSSFLTRFITTIGVTVYVPDHWSLLPVESRMAVLRHERVHMRQAKKWTHPVFFLLYLLAPLPVGVAYCRTKFEQEAYEESLTALQEYYGDSVLTNPNTKASMVAHFTTGEYFWMWPWKKSIQSWYDKVVARLLKK